MITELINFILSIFLIPTAIFDTLIAQTLQVLFVNILGIGA